MVTKENGTILEQHIMFNKKTVQGINSFYKQSKKEVTIPTANSLIEISKTQPNTSDNNILEPLEEECMNFDKTPSNPVTNIQTPTLGKSLSSENVETPQDIRNIRAQFSVLKIM